MSGFLGVLRNGAMIAAVAGGAGSVAYVLRAGHPPSLLLIALFVGWVFSPFAGLIAANIVSTRGSVVTQTTLHAVTLILAVLSLIIYATMACGSQG